MSDRYEVKDRRDMGAVIPSALDDYGLTPYEFRVYARIARRAGQGAHWESIQNTAIACKMGQQKVKEVLRFLLEAGMIERHSRPGKTSEYILTPSSSWVHPDLLDEVRARCRYHPGVLNTQVFSTPTTQVFSTPTTQVFSTPTTQVSRTPTKEYQEGIPIRNPRKESHEVILSRANARDDPSDDREWENESDPDPEAASKPERRKGTRRKSTDKAKSRVGTKNSDATAKAIYAILEELGHLKTFEGFWRWICGKYAAVPIDGNGRRPSVGKKHEAAAAFYECILQPDRLEDLRLACAHSTKIGAFEQVGLPHIVRWIRDGHWETILVQCGLAQEDVPAFCAEVLPPPKPSAADRLMAEQAANLMAVLQKRREVF